MTRKMFGVVIAVVLGGSGTFVLVSYVQDAEDRAVAGERMVAVIVASDRVAAGTAAEDLDRVTEGQRVPQKARGEQAITSLREVNGLVTTTELVPGEVLLRPRFANPGAVTKGVECGEGAAWTRGGHAVARAGRAVGGLIKPGSRVVAIGTPTTDADGTVLAGGVVAHQVLVTNVQVEDDSGEPSPDETQTVAPAQPIGDARGGRRDRGKDPRVRAGRQRLARRGAGGAHGSRTMSRLVLATASVEFEDRVRFALDDEVDGNVRYWRDSILRGDPSRTVKELVNGGADVVALGPGLPPETALELARRSTSTSRR